MKAYAASYVAEFDCERRCTVELDLTDARSRFTASQMEGRAEHVHKNAHEWPAQRVLAAADDAVVRTGPRGRS